MGRHWSTTPLRCQMSMGDAKCHIAWDSSAENKTETAWVFSSMQVLGLFFLFPGRMTSQFWQRLFRICTFLWVIWTFLTINFPVYEHKWYFHLFVSFAILNNYFMAFGRKIFYLLTWISVKDFNTIINKVVFLFLLQIINCWIL